MDTEQLEMEKSIRKGAMIWGVVGFVLVGLLAFWLLGGVGEFARIGGGALLGASAGFGVFKWSFSSRAKDALCKKCGAGFSITRTAHDEVLASSEDKSSREEQDDGSIKVTEWVNDIYDVTDVHTCAKCGDATVKQYQSTRRRDETTRIEGARGLARAGANAGQGETPTGVDVAAKVADAAPTSPKPTAGRASRSRD